MNEFLAGVLSGLNQLTGNYGLAIILFTLIIRILIFPLNLKSRSSMRKMQDLNPKLQAIQKKYANDKEKLNLKTSELYKKEGINPLSGCLPMLLSFPILIIMFGAMRQVANEQLISQVFSFLTGSQPNYEGFLWIKNLWMPDNPFYPAAPTTELLRAIPADLWQHSFNALGAETQTLINGLVPGLDFYQQGAIENIMTVLQQTPAYIEATSLLPGWSNINFVFMTVSVYTHFNGLFILPILAAVSQYLTTMLTPQPQQPAAEGQPNTGNFMKWFFPLFTLFICYNYNASFALYWVAANVIAAAETVIMNKYMDNKDKQEKAIANEEGSIK